MKKIVGEFKAFLMQGDLVTLAVAFVMAAAFGALITAFVTDWITPIIGAIFGSGGAFSDLSFTVGDSKFSYGHFIDAVIAFVAIAAAIFFFVVKPYQAYTARQATAESGPAPLTPEQQLLTEIRDLLKTRS